jgi:magnesium-protoporphyrin IX monomethyl ester (oxidative) cyclase
MVPPTAVTEATAAPGSNVTAKDPEKDTILTPRFYTTDFEAMAAMDLRPNEAELEAICEEFRKDYNRHHFVRNGEFDGAADQLIQKLAKYLLNF